MVEKTFPAQSISLPVVGGQGESVLVNSQEITLSLPTSIAQEVTDCVYLPTFVYAPVSSGQKAGEYGIWYHGVQLASADLLVTQAVEKNTYRPNVFVRIWHCFLRKFC
jgi:hypothetical protein